MEGSIDDFTKKVQKQFKECVDHTNEWRKDTEKWYDYVACKQWSDEDLAILNEQQRPPVTFNKTEVFVQAITGLEALNRQEVKFLPRIPGEQKQGPADLWSAAVDYVYEDGLVEMHNSHAFRDLVICGMGWTHTVMNYETNPDGDLDVEHKDPLFAYWDTRATHRNLADARWVGYIASMTKEEIEERWPDKADQISQFGLFDPDNPTQPHNATDAWEYANEARVLKDNDNVPVFQYQWYEKAPSYRILTPQGPREVTKDELDKVKEAYPEVPHVKTMKRKYYEAFFCGEVMLEKTELISNDFTLQCMTGKHDRNNNTFYGVVKNLIDPQDWLNKLYSQILHVINTNAKGGLLAESTAFEDPQQAEQEWANPASITWAQEGAVSQGKIIPKPATPYPQGMDRLMDVAIRMFTEVSGANIELLGLAEKVQPGVLEAQRKQAGITILSWCFDAMKFYRKRQGRVMGEFIREFLADQRLVRVAGEGNAQYLPLIKDALTLEYDVVVDESPSSANEKERTFAVIMQLLPIFKDMGYPLPQTLMEYLPLPAALTSQWAKLMQPNPQQQQMQQMMQQLQTMMAQLEAQKKQADVQKTQADTALSAAKAEKTRVETQFVPLEAVG